MNRTAIFSAIALTLLASAATASVAQAADPGAGILVSNYYFTKNFTRGAELAVKVTLVTPKNVISGDKVAVWDPTTKVVYASANLPIPAFAATNLKIVLVNPAMVGLNLELVYLRPVIFGNPQILATSQELKVVADTVSDAIEEDVETLAYEQRLLDALAAVHEAKMAAHQDAILANSSKLVADDLEHDLAAARLTEHDAKFGIQQASLDEGKTHLAELAANAQQTADKVASLQSRVESLHQAAVEAAANALANFIQWATDQVAALNARVNEHEARIAALEAPEFYGHSDSIATNDCATVTVSATCDEGDFASAGGCDIGAGDGWRLVKVGVVNDESGRPVGWTCRVRADSNVCPTTTVKADVTCRAM